MYIYICRNTHKLRGLTLAVCRRPKRAAHITGVLPVVGLGLTVQVRTVTGRARLGREQTSFM